MSGSILVLLGVFTKKKNKYITSKTLIDVAIHNGESLINTKVIGCPLSDHHFVIAALESNSPKIIHSGNLSRQLSVKNLLKISKELGKLHFSFDRSENINSTWNNLKNEITAILDKRAPQSFLSLAQKKYLPGKIVSFLKKKDSEIIFSSNIN